MTDQPERILSTTKIIAPFTIDQVVALDAYQHARRFHPFTCPNRDRATHGANAVDLGALVPTVRGWMDMPEGHKCRTCGLSSPCSARCPEFWNTNALPATVEAKP